MVGGYFVDVVIMAAAYAAAFALRFDFQEPRWGWGGVWTSFVTVCVIQLLAFVVFDCLRRWRVRARDIVRFILAFGTALSVLIVIRFIFRSDSQLQIRPPFSINVLNGFFWAMGAMWTRWLWTKFVNARTHEAQLLNRKERTVIDGSVKEFLSGKCVLVTGAGGTIGSEIVRQALAAGASRVLMVERCEWALYEICEEVLAGGRCRSCWTSTSRRRSPRCWRRSIRRSSSTRRPTSICRCAS